METEIYITFLRHGRSRADDEKVNEGRYDSPLTDIGRTQAQTRAHEFLSRDIHFDLIVSSTLQRAHETAKIIGKWRFPPPRINGKKVKIRYLYTVNFRLE